MKCVICNTTKGKRMCKMRNNQLICSKCCGTTRNFNICDTECIYMPEEKYELIRTNSIELTEVGRGKVIQFSESLFLPNITDCLYINIKEMQVNIKNPILVSVKLEFEIKCKSIRNVSKNEIYLKDSWKRDSKLMPFLQIYTIGSGKIINEVFTTNGIIHNIVIENNHIDTWLPNSKIENRKLSDEERKNLNMPNEIGVVPVLKGKHFIGKNNTFLADINFDKKYELKFDIIYDSIHTIDNNVVLTLGCFFPFNLVNYSNYSVNLLNNYSFNKKSEIQLLLPFENDEINAFLIPLESNNKLSSPQYVKHDFENFGNKFYYDRYTILNQVFYLDSKSKDIAHVRYEDLPIFTGIYDTFNKVYDDEYAPAKVTIYNNHDEIRKYKIEVEIQGLSYKKIQEIYVNPHSISNIKIAPQLVENEIDNLTSNTEKEIYIKVQSDDETLLENTNKCLIYPREIFIEMLENYKKDWKIDFRSFLARWITPNAKEIDEIISKAAQKGDILGGSTENLLKAEEDIKKIYDTLNEIKYSIRTLSFSEGDYHTQRISLPKNTLRLNSGNCIDLSILLASCFEAIKLKPYIVLMPGHAIVMVELKDGNKIYIESTALGNKEYYEAKEIGIQKYKENFNAEGQALNSKSYIVDVSIARKSQIYPMN